MPIAYGESVGLSQSKGWVIGWDTRRHIRFPPAPDIAVPAILFNLAQRWSPTMSQTELYEATRDWWTLGERKLNAEYAFAVGGGAIRGVYTIDPASWTQNGDSKWRFAGESARDLEMKYRNTSVRHIFRRGRNAIRYINC